MRAKLRAADLLTRSNVPVSVAARVLAREPDSPVTRALKLWGDDENPFKRLIISNSEEARVWRETMGTLLGNSVAAFRSRSGPHFPGHWGKVSSAARSSFSGGS